jgi:hypothetical protein
MSEHSAPVSETASGVSYGGDDNPFHSIENATKYKFGGYHPLEFGDELHNDRYRIIHRLGHGGFSTVWLALDRHHESTSASPDASKGKPNSRYVAVKIGRADNQTDEAVTLRQLQAQLLPLAPGECPFFVRMRAEFEIHGPNGTHRCIVAELLGPSVRAAKECRAIEGSYHLLPVCRVASGGAVCEGLGVSPLPGDRARRYVFPAGLDFSLESD